jgi:hypothetical protein
MLKHQAHLQVTLQLKGSRLTKQGEPVIQMTSLLHAHNTLGINSVKQFNTEQDK